MSYSCNPDCMPTVQLGDDDKIFKDVGEQISDPQRLRFGQLGKSPRNSASGGSSRRPLRLERQV